MPPRKLLIGLRAQLGTKWILSTWGKDYASLVTPEGNFWVEEGKFASGYKLIELDISNKSQPSALIQKGDQQAWIGLRTSARTRLNDKEFAKGVQQTESGKDPGG